MFDISLLALLALVFSANAMDNAVSQDATKVYQFIMRDPAGKAAAAFYASKNASVVEQLPFYIKDSKVINNSVIKTSDVDRALFIATHDLLLNKDLKHASTTTGVSLVLSALWNTVERLGLSKYITIESDILNALVYGFVHSAAVFVAEEQIKKLS